MKHFKDFVQAYENGELQLTSKVKYKVRDVIENNDLLFNGQFESPKDGTFEKIFYNIGFAIFRNFYQASNLDLKNISMISLNGKSLEALALVKMALHSYLKRIKFSTFIDELRYFIKDGTTVVKIVDGEPRIVRNANIIIPAHSEGIQKTGLAERCFYTWDDMLSYKSEWKENWHAIEELKEKMDKTNTSDFIIYEWWKQDEFDGKTHKGCVRMLDATLSEPTNRLQTPNPTEWDPYIELDRFKTTYKKKRNSNRMSKKLGEYEELYPYKELHFIKVPGRWLSFSVFELINGIITAYNRKWNLADKKDIFDLMGVFTHTKNASSPSIAQSLLNNIESGTVVEMEVGEELQRLVTDTKTSDLINNLNKLEELARQITGASSQGMGQDMPATTTATVAVVNKQTQQTTYDYIIGQMSIFLTELFEDFLFEAFLDEIDVEEMNSITGDPTELQELDKFYLEGYFNNEATGLSVKRYEELKAQNPDGEVSWEQLNMLKDLENAEKEQVKAQLAKMNDTRWADIKKTLVKGLNFFFEFYINAESFDKNVKITNLQAMKANTELSPKKIDMRIMDLMDENPKAYEKTEEEKAAEIAMMQTKANIEAGTMPQPIPTETQQFTNANMQ